LPSTKDPGIYFWVPLSYREGLCAVETLLIIGKHMIHLDLCHFAHGTSWTQCHSSAITAPSLPSTGNANFQPLTSSSLSPDCSTSSNSPIHNQHPDLGSTTAEFATNATTMELSTPTVHNPDHSATQVDYLGFFHLHYIVLALSSLVAAYFYCKI
jgi:hypothetical protein